MAFSTPQCIFYKVNVSNSGEPILGTMVNMSTPKLTNNCTEVLLPNTQMPTSKVVAGVTHTQCFPPSGFRYFYKIGSDGQILGNSMFQHIGNPPHCDGTYSLLEFIIYN